MVGQKGDVLSWIDSCGAAIKTKPDMPESKTDCGTGIYLALVKGRLSRTLGWGTCTKSDGGAQALCRPASMAMLGEALASVLTVKAEIKSGEYLETSLRRPE